MKLFISLVLSFLVAAKQAQAQCDFTFCGGLENIPDPSVIINPDDAVADQVDCQTIFATVLIPNAFTSAEECASVKMLENWCCPAKATRECFLCGSADARFNKNKDFLGMLNCGELDTTFAILPAGEECKAAKADTPIDFASFCECSGAVPPKTCKVCSDDQEVNATALPEPGSVLTCCQGYELTTYIKSDTLCSELVTDEAKSNCCVAKTLAKTSSGSAISSSVINNFATALIVGLAAFVT